HEPAKVRSTVERIRKALQDFKPGDEEAQRETKPAVSGDGKRFRISFAEVQRMRIRKLQCQLVRHVVKMRLDGHESPGWEESLEQYSKSLCLGHLVARAGPEVNLFSQSVTGPRLHGKTKQVYS